MSTDRSPDRESFQTFLANAFLVQESGIDTQSLSAFINVQRSIANGGFGVDEAMSLVADVAHGVANADGVAIALLKGDHLVYRAGNGSAANRIGQHVTAVLSASAHNGRREILRVENANSDSRIEAEICRRFGATSLLILPIYHEHAVAGVMEIIFNQEHAFQDREVRTYRLLAGLVEEAMAREARVAQTEAPAQPAAVIPPTFTRVVVHETQEAAGSDAVAPVPASKTWLCRACAAAARIAPSAVPPLQKASLLADQLKRAFLTHRGQSVAAASVVSALVIVTWVAHAHRTASSLAGSAIVKPNEESVNRAFAKPLASHASNTRSAARGVRETDDLPGFQRKRVGPNEVDYLAADVTMRVFTPKHRAPRTPGWSRQIEIGDDVTVRYFASRPATAMPVSAAGQAAEHSLPVSK